MVAVDFLNHQNPSTCSGVAPGLGAKVSATKQPRHPAGTSPNVISVITLVVIVFELKRGRFSTISCIPQYFKTFFNLPKRVDGIVPTDLVNLNHGRVPGTTPELTLPSSNFHTTPTGGRLSSQLI
ncbi:hypothetical protein TNCV_2763751 [Trichonephila clavipes]|nr:hypothetical protein TNCV_2763751 [Trichonephila clavipes]